MTHIPFRSCCRYCVKGREREEDRRKANEAGRQAPESHLDNVLMGEEMEGKTFAFLVARERETTALPGTWFLERRQESGYAED